MVATFKLLLTTFKHRKIWKKREARFLERDKGVEVSDCQNNRVSNI